MNRVALQLYTVREICAVDLPGAIERTASLGFDGVELYDLCGHRAEAVRDLLDEYGLVACGRHAGLPLMESSLDELAVEMDVLGTDRLVVSWIEPPTTASEADVMVGRLAAVAGRADALGLQLGFHNHEGELAVLDDGRSFLDRLRGGEGGSPFLELDLGWIWYAGFDPIAVLERCAGKVPLVHVKDMRNAGGPVFVPLGGGEVDYARLGAAAGRAGVEWLIVEQDDTNGQGFDAVEASLDELRRVLGVAA